MSKIKLDLHPVYDKGGEIEAELTRVILEAIDKRIPLIEIITGKGSGALRKHVQRFLSLRDIKKLYYRLENDGNNIGRVFVHLRHDNSSAFHG